MSNANALVYPDALQIVCVLFPNLTQLDLTGPYEVFHRLPGVQVHLAAKTLDPVRSEGGLTIVPTTTFDDAPQPDLLFAPGGPGVNDAMLDDEVLAFLRRGTPRWIASACTGALILGAAGLLDGYNAATHWASMEFLAAFGANAIHERVVVDRNRFTGGGVTAGIDIALRFAREIYGAPIADEIALGIEYAPASEDTHQRVLERLRPTLERRREAVRLAATRMRA